MPWEIKYRRMASASGMGSSRPWPPEGIKIASLPIVAFTANAFKEDLEMAKEAGMDVFLCKPATQEQMAEAFVEAFDIAKKK